MLDFVDAGSAFAESHGVIALVLVLILSFVGFLIWKLFSTMLPLLREWARSNIEANQAHAAERIRQSDAMDLIARAVSASEKSNELMLAKLEALEGRFTEMETKLDQIFQ